MKNTLRKRVYFFDRISKPWYYLCVYFTSTVNFTHRKHLSLGQRKWSEIQKYKYTYKRQRFYYKNRFSRKEKYTNTKAGYLVKLTEVQ